MEQQHDPHRLYIPLKRNFINGPYSYRTPIDIPPIMPMIYGKMYINIEISGISIGQTLYSNNEFILPESYEQNLLSERKRKKENSSDGTSLSKKQKVDEFILPESYEQNLLSERKRKKENSNDGSRLLKKQKIEKCIVGSVRW
jgi:hypothetical protein